MADNNSEDIIQAVADAQEEVKEVKPVEVKPVEVKPIEVKPVITPAESTPAPTPAPVAAPAAAATTAAADKKAAAEAKKIEKAAKKQAAKAEAAQKKADKKNSKSAQKAAEKQARIDACPKEYKPISTSGYFWRSFISFIPVIGFIYTIIMMLLPRNKNLKNFEKSIFIYYVIGIILLAIAFIILVVVNGSSVDGIVKAFGYFIEELASAK